MDGVLECPWWVQGVVAESGPTVSLKYAANRDLLVTFSQEILEITVSAEEKVCFQTLRYSSKPRVRV